MKKYGKKLIGRTDMADALKRLDKLTQEEARMAVAQNLKATHTVDERVRGVANMAVAIDNRVAGVDDRVASVDDRVAKVDDKVASVDDKVASIDDKVTSVDNKVASVGDKVASVDDKVAGIDNKVKGIDAKVSSVDDRVVVVDDKVAEVLHDGKEAKQVIKQTANDVDLVKGSSSPKHLIVETDGIL
jgi:archaellum component FlaC